MSDGDIQEPTGESEVHLSDGSVARVPDSETVDRWSSSYADWSRLVGAPRPAGHATVLTKADPLHWTPLSKPLSECTVALVSTGGVHLRGQEPFEVFGEEGDSSSREIPGDVDTANLTVTHTHYATEDALSDINVMFPLDRLRELDEQDVIGGASPLHFGLMGFIPDPSELVSEVAPTIARALKNHGVDVVALTGG